MPTFKSVNLFYLVTIIFLILLFLVEHIAWNPCVLVQHIKANLRDFMDLSKLLI